MSEFLYKREQAQLFLVNFGFVTFRQKKDAKLTPGTLNIKYYKVAYYLVYRKQNKIISLLEG
jgi:hypothetical protein